MRVADILSIKGSTVKTVTPNETALEFSEKLRAAQIGAMIVSNDGNSIDGIISERGAWRRMDASCQGLPSPN
jgi:CBS domain-containing protein